jgi:hypothetical protein
LEEYEGGCWVCYGSQVFRCLWDYDAGNVVTVVQNLMGDVQENVRGIKEMGIGWGRLLVR